MLIIYKEEMLLEKDILERDKLIRLYLVEYLNEELKTFSIRFYSA